MDMLAKQTAAGPEAAGTEQLFHLPHIGMWTKLRPFTHEFLRRASEVPPHLLFPPPRPERPMSCNVHPHGPIP